MKIFATVGAGTILDLKYGKFEDLIELVTERLRHDKRYEIDPIKLENLGWKPTFTVEAVITQTIQCF